MADGFVPPQEVRNNAKRGLELRQKHGRGGTEVGVARARDLSNGKSLSLDTINRMVSYFARHEVDKQGEGWGTDSAGYIAWLLWGGDAGRSWANRIAKENDKKEKSTVNDLTTAYFGITKADKNADGTLMVYGKATDDSLDIDQQICDPVWLDTAMPNWFKTGGNIREQHSQIAAGVAKEYEKKADGHFISVLVVDPVSVKKVDAGVLKGFSIGIKSPRVVRDQKAANGRIIDGQIVEVSLVDRPANPNCQLVLAKSVNGESGVWKVEELIEKSDEVTPETTEVVAEVAAEEVAEVIAEEVAPLVEEAPVEGIEIAKIEDEEKLEQLGIEKADKEPNYEAVNRGGEGSEPADKELYNRVKAEAKKKFDVYPSAYANAWLVREYKKRGGTYKKETKKSLQIPESFLGDLLKFDKTQYEAAREALASLISVEAEEMKTGHNEIMSIRHLLEAVAHLHAWYEGEEAEGEVMEETEMELSEKSAHKDMKPMEGETKSDYMKRCKEAGMDDDTIKSMCDKYMSAEKSDAATDAVPTAQTGANLDTVTNVTTGEAPKSAEPEEEEKEEVSEATEVAAEDIEAIVEKAVKSATESIRSEVASLVSAKEAALEKAATLETELATAKSLAIGGGPKRTAKPIDTNATNDLITKALVFKAKANAATDPTLAKGYKALADEFLAKANSTDSN
jgi:hypothetical protein